MCLDQAPEPVTMLPGIPLAASGEQKLASVPSAKPASSKDAQGTSQLQRSGVNESDFMIEAVLGRGGYGKVLLVRLKSTHEVFAMKVLRKKDLIAKKQVQRTIAERDIMSRIRHPFIVELRFAFQVLHRRVGRRLERAHNVCYVCSRVESCTW